MKRKYEFCGRTHLALNRKKYCPNCGGHEYIMMEQIWPPVQDRYFVQCAQCGYDTTESYSKKSAMKNWMETQ